MKSTAKQLLSFATNIKIKDLPAYQNASSTNSHHSSNHKRNKINLNLQQVTLAVQSRMIRFKYQKGGNKLKSVKEGGKKKKREENQRI